MTITKDILRNKMYPGGEQATELLYSRYGGMLFSYILQFVPERPEAEDLLAEIFSRLATRLEEACKSSLSVYCWLQVEARKIILEFTHKERNDAHEVHYFSLLADAPPDHQWVFRELFLYGRQKEALALERNEDLTYIDQLLRESLLIIRNKLG